MASRKGRAPISKYPDQPPVRDVDFDLIFGKVGQSESGESRV